MTESGDNPRPGVQRENRKRCVQRTRGSNKDRPAQTSNSEKGHRRESPENGLDQPRFTALCPKCRSEAAQGPHSKQRLRELHGQDMLQFYCESCDHQWEPTVREKENVRKLIY